MTTDYDPELYHLLHRGNPGDVDWYQQRCQGARRILELGCGDGRVLLSLARAGVDVVGIDSSQAMLARCAERFHRAGQRAELVCGDMTLFALPWRFDRILIPFNSLYCLTTDEAQLTCLRSARAHLAPGGQLLFDVYAADPVAPNEQPTACVEEHLIAQFHDGQRHIEVYETSSEDLTAQQINATYSYHSTWDDGRQNADRWSILQRYLFPTQLLALLARADLALEGFYGDFDQSPFTPTSMHMVVAASLGDEAGG